MPQPLRFGFDARLAGSRHAGIGRYGEELLRFFVQQRSLQGRPVRWVVWVFADHGLSWLDQLGQENQIELRITTIRHYTVAEQTLWWRELDGAQLDLLYVPHFNVPLLYNKPYVMTLHDLLWHTQNNARATTLSPWMYRLKRSAYKYSSESAIRRAHGVIVPSKVVFDQVRQLTNKKEGVHIVSEGVSEAYARVQGIGSPLTRKPYCIYTGSLYPHKNFEVILQALRQDPTMMLLVASARNVFWNEAVARAEELGVIDQISWKGYVPDKELAGLYQRAVALIQPSRSEGFGLTGLEALAAGCAVLASDIPIFHEVYGDSAVFFSPDSGEELAQAWQKLLAKPPSRQDRLRWQKRARSYRWDTMSERIWQIFGTVYSHL